MFLIRLFGKQIKIDLYIERLLGCELGIDVWNKGNELNRKVMGQEVVMIKDVVNLRKICNYFILN